MTKNINKKVEENGMKVVDEIFEKIENLTGRDKEKYWKSYYYNLRSSIGDLDYKIFPEHCDQIQIYTYRKLFEK